MIQAEYTIPKMFHYIWVGGKIYPEYLEHIRYFARVCAKSGYAVKIWVDTSSYFENRDDFYDIENLTLCHTENILQNLVDDDESGYTIQEKEDFIKSIYFEYLSPPNYAAVSDFLRIEILRQEGGIYLDTDTMLHAYTKQQDIVLDIDFSILNKIGIAHTDRNNNLIAASINHPALIACGKMMIDKMTEQHSLPEEEYRKTFEEQKQAKTHADRIKLDKELQKYFKDEHCWRTAKKSLHIIAYGEIGNQTDPYAKWRYEQSLITTKLSYAPPRWHFTIMIGPESLRKTVIAWQNFLKNENIVSINACFTVLSPLEALFNTVRCDSTWCNAQHFIPHSLIEGLTPGNSEQETAQLENSIVFFENRVLPLTFSALSKNLHEFPENVVEVETLKVKPSFRR